MNDTQELIKSHDQKGILEFLKQPSLKIAEFLTGFLASEKNEWKLSAGKLVQAIIKNDFFTQLGREIESYRKEGKIKENYLENSLNRMTLVELLKCIDEDAPDDIKFKAMQTIFLKSVSTTDVDRGTEELAYELMKICRKLGTVEILILSVAYRSIQEEKEIQTSSRQAWIIQISERLPYNYRELVELYEENLEKLKLISERMYADGSGIHSSNSRLTALGVRFCKFIFDDKNK